MRAHSLLLFVWLLAIQSARAQPPIQALFPASNQVAGWVVQGPPKLYPGERVFDYMDGAGEIPRGYGLRQLGSARYRKGKATLEVAIFEMGRPADAFGYFSARSFLEHSPRSRDRQIPLDHPARLYEAVGVLTFWKGRYTVVVQPEIGRPDDATLLQFARAVSARIREKGRLPDLLGRLPQAGIVLGSARYIRGKSAFDATLIFTPRDVFDIAKGAEAVGAEYSLAGVKPTLILIRYPNAGAARAAFEAYRRYLVSRKAAPAPAGLPDSFAGMDSRQKGTGARLRGSILGMVTGARDTASARAALHLLGGRS